VIEAKSTRSSLPVVRSAAEQVRRHIGQLESAGIRAGELVAMPYVSPAGRRYLRDLGLGYADPAGNLRLQAETPGFSTQSLGADRDPRPQSSALRSLQGPGAGRAVRAFTDFRPPLGIRELAKRVGVSAATLSRVARALEGEGLLERAGRGAIATVDWEGAIRRWVQDYGVIRTNRASSFLDPGGIARLTAALQRSNVSYAVMGHPRRAGPGSDRAAPAGAGLLVRRGGGGRAAGRHLPIAAPTSSCLSPSAVSYSPGPAEYGV